MVERTLESRVKKGKLSNYIDYSVYGGGSGWVVAHNAHKLSRSELFFKYPGPYMKLTREGKLKEVIPKDNRFLPTEETNEIIRAHEKYNANLILISKECHHSPRIVTKYLRKLGLPIRPRGYPGQDSHYHNN